MSERKEMSERQVMTIFVIGTVIFFLIIGVIGASLRGSSSSFSSSSSYKTCASSHREFSATSSNGKKIARSGMCNNCYNNYKSMKSALDELPVD